MGLFDHTDAKLAEGPTLLLTADPGPAFEQALHRYDPEVRRWHGRMVFGNGVLLFGPVEMTPKLAGRSGLPATAAIAWYARAAVQRSSESRAHSQKIADGERMLLGLVARFGGTIHPEPTGKKPALVASVYSEAGLPTDQVIETLRPQAGDLAAEDVKENGSYALSGRHAPFYTAYWPPGSFVAKIEPAALGELRKGRPHHWDLHAGVAAGQAPHELCTKVGEAALALAARCGGIVVDVYGFRIESPQELLPR